MQDDNTNFQGTNHLLLTFTQGNFSDLVKDLILSQEKAEVLASRLKEKNNLIDRTKVTFYCPCESGLLQLIFK